MALGLPQMRFDIFARDRSGPAWRGVENSIQRTQRSLAGFMRLAGPLLGVGGAAVGGTALAYMARDALEFADALVQAADRTSFAVEELEALRYAGRLNRVQFTQTDMAMQRFSRRLAEAASGSGELANDLAALNIPLRDANGQMRSSYDILLDYADAIQNAESEQEQLRLAFRAFDSEGAALVTVLRQGAEGLREYRSEAEQAGAIMGDQIAREASEAATALERMNLQITAERNRVIAEHADELRAFADALSQVMTMAIQAAAAVGNLYDRFGRSEGGRLAIVPLDAEEAAAQIESALALQQDLAGRTTGTPLGRMHHSRLIRELGSEALAREGITVGVNSELTGELVHQLLELLNNRIAALRGMEFPELTAPLDRTQIDGNSFDTSVQPRINPRRPLVGDSPTALQSAGESAADFSEFLNDMEAAVDRAAYALAVSAARDLKEQLVEQRAEFSRTFADIFAGGIMAAFDGDLQEYIARRLRQAAYNGLFEAFERLGRIVFDRNNAGGQNAGGLIQAGVSLLGGSFGGKRSAGGNVWPGQFYQWQENGREYFAPNEPGRVIPAGAAMSASPMTLQQHFHLDARGAVMTEQLLADFQARADASAQSAVAQGLARTSETQRRSSPLLKG